MLETILQIWMSVQQVKVKSAVAKWGGCGWVDERLKAEGVAGVTHEALPSLASNCECPLPAGQCVSHTCP